MKKLFLIIFLVLFLTTSFSPVLAQNYDLEVPLIGGQTSVSTPAEYIRMVFIFGLGLVGITALFAMVLGGFIYLLAGDNESRKTSGKDWIWGGISGLVLLLCSWLILYTINPQLVSLTNPKMETITIPPHLGLGYNSINSFSDVSSLPAINDPNIAAVIKQASQTYGVPEDMIKFVLGIESNGKIDAVSPKGAQGLMQLMPGTAAAMGVTNPFDPAQNIMGGTKYLSIQYNKYGNWTDALGAYNAGPGRVDQYGGGANIPFSETQKYIAKAKAVVPQYF